jgi:hypothetical protein
MLRRHAPSCAVMRGVALVLNTAGGASIRSYTCTAMNIRQIGARFWRAHTAIGWHFCFAF